MILLRLWLAAFDCWLAILEDRPAPQVTIFLPVEPPRPTRSATIIDLDQWRATHPRSAA